MNQAHIDYLYNQASKHNNIGLNSISYCINNIDNKSNIDSVNQVFLYHLNKDTQLSIKEYYKYYNHPLLTKYLVDMVNITDNNIILDGNMKVNSFTKELIKKSKNIFGFQNNNIVKNLCSQELLSQGVNFSNYIEDDVLSNDFKFNNELLNFDIIFFDLPIGIHNIIHAKCCNRIKNLKLRGTKSEPLLLQLIMMALNKNGKAIVIVPDSLLFSDSKQPIETREYLLNNYNVKKIIELDEKFYYTKGIKSSIIYFENNGKTTDIKFSKLILNNNITEENIITINIENIKKNIHSSLYYKIYNEKECIFNKETIIYKFNDIFKITRDVQDNNYICLTKYYKNNNSILLNEKMDNDIEYYIIQNDNNNFIPEFSLFFIYYEINKNIDLYIKGKMKQFDIDKIICIDIPYIDKEKQNSIISYNNYTKNLINNNITQIKNYKILKKNLIKTITYHYTLDLSNIINCYENIQKNKDYIRVIKNSLSAGKVYYINNDSENSESNSYYLTLKNDDFILEYIYFYLKYIKNKLSELSKLTPQNNLIKSNLLNIKIPVISTSLQKIIINYSKDFNNNINKLKFENKNITQKDIMKVLFINTVKIYQTN